MHRRARTRIPSRDRSGQAALEYVGVLLAVAVLIAAAGTVAAPGSVGRAVASGVRAAVCVVAGDVCRPADAVAAGLQPCVVSSRGAGARAAATVLVLRLGSGHEWSVARRSDGSVEVVELRDGRVGATAEVGVGVSPLGLRLGASGGYDATVRAGRGWVLPDAATATRFLAAARRRALDRWPPAWRSGDLGGELSASAGASAGGVPLTGVELSASAAAGARVGRDGSTVYVRAELDGPEAFVIGAGSRGRGGVPVTVELTRAGGAPRELAFREARPGPGPGQVTELVARLDLRDPAQRAMAAPLLARRLPWPPAVRADLREAARHAVADGTVERAVYEVAETARRLDLSAGLGAGLGLQVEEVRSARRLVAAQAWVRGSPARERYDCLSAA